MIPPIKEILELDRKGDAYVLEHIAMTSNGERLMHYEVCYVDEMTHWIKLRLFRFRDVLGNWRDIPNNRPFWTRLEQVIPFSILKEGEF